MQMTTGLTEVDDLIGGLQIGDNVVWQTLRPIEQPIIGTLVTASPSSGLVYVSFTEPAAAILKRFGPRWRNRSLLLLDCSPAGEAKLPERRNPHHDIRRLEDPRDPEQVLAALRKVEESYGEGSTYLFDNLTVMQDLWGPEPALAMFLEHCPRLYELRTVAYWFLRKEAHDASFLARLHRTTQVVFDVGPSNGNHLVRVSKAAGRADAVGRAVELAVKGGTVEVIGQQTRELTKTGQRLKAQRLARGMSQAELARRIGISASALSQAENGVRGLSEETLQFAYSVLGGGAAPSLPYTVARRRARRSHKLAAGLKAEDVLDEPSRMSVHILEFAPGASGRRPPFATKQKEVVVVLSGVLELQIGAVSEMLQAGDAIVIRDEPVAGWSNPGSSATRVLWSILPPVQPPA